MKALLNSQIQMKEDVTLPVELAKADLTLSEMGVLSVLMMYPHLSFEEKRRWDNDEEFHHHFIILQKTGVVKVDGDDIEINIQKKKKNMKREGLIEYDDDFWDIDDYDENDNPIFSHPSNMGDEDGGRYYYKFCPFLMDGRICFDEMSDADVTSTLVNLVSLEEAREYVEEELKKERQLIQSESEYDYMNQKLKDLLGEDKQFDRITINAALKWWMSVKGTYSDNPQTLKGFALGYEQCLSEVDKIRS